MTRKKRKKEARDEQAPETDDAPDAPETDVSQIDAAELESRDFPSLPADYRVAVAEKAFEAVKDHADSDTSVEQCGVLAGRILTDSGGPYLLVEEVIEGAATRRSGSQVTFTHETWQHVHQVMEDRFPELRIVGWYHSHPGLGVFLSDMDQFIQDNFFNAPHSVALVYDPCSEAKGIFYWREGRSERLRRYWIGGELCYDLETAAPGGQDAAAAAEDEREEPERERLYSPARVEPDESRADAKSLAMWAIFGAIAVLVVFWLGGFVPGSVFRRSLNDQRKQVEDLIRAGLFRDGLDRELATVLLALNRASQRIELVRTDLSQQEFSGDQGEAAAGFKAEALQRLDSAALTLRQAEGHVGKMAERYLSAERIARQMDLVATLPEELDLLKTRLAQVCVNEAQYLLSQPKDDGAAARFELARRLRDMAVEFAPRLEP
ncbi:MAG: Mov34/MPN/PAD-1 family protein [Planctomycetota bacterium]